MGRLRILSNHFLHYLEFMNMEILASWLIWKVYPVTDWVMGINEAPLVDPINLRITDPRTRVE